MLVRTYRLTDKLGVVVLKSCVGFSQLVLDRFGRVTGVGQHGTSGIVGDYPYGHGWYCGLIWRICALCCWDCVQ